MSCRMTSTIVQNTEVYKLVLGPDRRLLAAAADRSNKVQCRFHLHLEYHLVL